MAGTAEPPFNQRDLIYAAARKLGTLTEDGKVRPQVTATKLGLGPNGTQRIRRLLDGDGILHWDEAYLLYEVLGWVNEEAVQHELRQSRRAADQAARKAQALDESQRRDGR